MDIQAISRLLKKNGANIAAGASDASAAPTNAFSALVETMGARFGTNLGDVNNLASKLIKNDDLNKTARVDEDNAPVRAKDDDKKTDEKPKAAKSKKKADDNDTSDTAANDDQKATETDANANKAQSTDAAATQAAVAAAVDVPIVVETQAVAVTTAVVQAAAAVDTTTPVEQAVEQAAQTAVDPTAQIVTKDVAATAAVETAQIATVTDAPKAVETAQNTFQQQINTAAAAQATDEETVEVAAPIVKQETATKAETAASNRQQVRSAAAQEQSQDLARTLNSDDKIQVQVKVAGPRFAATTLTEPSSYNIYTGYTAGTQDSTANGQVGKGDATNALVQKSSAEQNMAPVLPSPNVALPQAQTTQQGTQQTARADVEVQAVSATSQSSSSGGQTNSGSEFGSTLNNGNNSTSSTNTSQATAQTNAPQRPAATVQEVVDQIKVSITRASKVGMDRVTIQLKPVELGRIDVKLEMSDDHKVRVTVMADNKETLNLLQSDSHTLERALNDAGLRTDANNLHFSLREGSDQRTSDGQNGRNAANGSAQDDDADVAEDTYLPTFDYAESARQRGGVDTFA